MISLWVFVSISDYLRENKPRATGFVGKFLNMNSKVDRERERDTKVEVKISMRSLN